MKAVRLHFHASTWRYRLAAYFRALARPKALLPFFVVAMLPLVLALLMGTALLASFLLMGVCGALALMLFGAFISVLHRQPARTITFDLSGVREEVGDRVYDYGWQWIEAVVEDDDTITLHCKKPMRSFTVVSSAHERTLVIDKRSTDVAELKKLLNIRGN